MLKRIYRNFPTSLFSFRSGMYGVLDQGLYAFGNFGVNIVLARILEPAQYGVFAVANAFFLFFAAFHSAILTEPMMVFGSGKYAGILRTYLTKIFYGHWVFTGLASLVVSGIGLIMIYLDAQFLGSSLLTLAICLPLMLLIWLMRRIFYVLRCPKMAFLGSIFYSIFILVSILFCIQTNRISVNATFVVLGIGSVLTSVGLLFVLHRRLLNTDDTVPPPTILNDHWKFGSWNSLAAAVFWISGGMVTIVVAGFLGLAASAAIAAVLNIFRPLNLLMQGTALLILPGMSALINKNAPAQVLAKNSSQVMVLLVGGTFLYGLIVTVFSESLFHFLYAGKYDVIDGYWELIVLVGLSYTASAFVQICTSELKASENVRAVISVWSVSAVFVFCAIFPAMMLWEINGAMTVVLISYALAAILAKKMVLTMREVLAQSKGNLVSSLPTRA